MSQRSFILDLEIDQLMLDGCSPAEARRVGAAVERELPRLFSDQGLPDGLARPFEAARIDAGSFHVRPAGGAERTGREIAAVLYQNLAR